MTRETGICPVCNGTTRRNAKNVNSKTVYADYDPETDTLPCNNCGGQTMYGKPSGRTPLRDDGTPCIHEYNARSVARHHTIYTCKHCNYVYNIDSGD